MSSASSANIRQSRDRALRPTCLAGKRTGLRNLAVPEVGLCCLGCLSARPSCCASPGFAGTTVPGRFARTAPVFGGRPGAGPAPLHPAALGPMRDDVAGGGPLRVHFARTAPAAAFSWAGPVVLGHLAPPVQAQPVPGERGRPGPVFFLCRPGLKLLEQLFSDKLAVLSLAVSALRLPAVSTAAEVSSRAGASIFVGGVDMLANA